MSSNKRTKTQSSTAEASLAITSTPDLVRDRELQELRRKVEEQAVALKELNEEMEFFCTSVSHDMRAPLRIIRGFADILLQDVAPKLSAEERGNLERIINNTVRLDRLLHDLLVYSRLARAELTLRPVDLRELIDDVVSAQRGTPRERSAQITVQGPPARVLAQPGMLSQALWNLIDNAHKFGPPAGAPTIAIRTEPLERKVRIWVEDNGIGIAPTHHERIFGLFDRLINNRAEGTGAGLAIAKRVVTRMGGSIGVESEENRGSRFWIELPTAE